MQIKPDTHYGPLGDVANLSSEEILERAAGLELPSDLEITGLVGKGYRCTAFRAQFRGRVVALKVYNPTVVLKNRKRYGISIARFEHDRNQRFYAHSGLRPYVAEPIACYESEDPSANLFVQELLTDPTLWRLHHEGYAPPECFFEKIDLICDLCNPIGLCDLDLNSQNICVRKGEGGDQPVLFDFNMVPRHERRNNPLVSILYWTRLRQPNYRDRARLQTLRDQYRAA